MKTRQKSYETKFRYKNNTFKLGNLLEGISDEPQFILYTIAREDTKYPSLYQAYMNEEDFTEFNFASKYFESYQHWKKVCELKLFAGHISEWREELELKVKARNLKSLIDKAVEDTSVAKFLLGNKWIEDTQKIKGTNLRGRPSKEEIKGHLRLISSQEKQIDDDYERIKA